MIGAAMENSKRNAINFLLDKLFTESWTGCTVQLFCFYLAASLMHVL
jgi:hypothetical protein